MGNVQSGQGPDEGLAPLILESSRGIRNAGQLPNLRKRAYQARDPIFSAAVDQDSATFSRLMTRSRSAASRTDREGFMALHYATLAKWLDGVTMAISAGADVNAVSSQGYTALMLAAAVGAADIAAALLDAGAATAARSARGANALGFAAQHGTASQAVLDLLIARGAPLTDRGFRRRSLLEIVLLGHADLEMLRSLLEAGANPSERNPHSNNVTPLHLAARAFNAAAIEALVAHGADVNARADNSITPAMMCFAPGAMDDPLGGPSGPVDEGRRRAAFSALVAAGADVNAAVNGRRITVLHMAMMHCTEEATVSVILESPALNLDAIALDAVLGRSKGTMLHLASSRGWLRVVRALTAAGASLQARNRDGFTPLHSAALAGGAAVVAALLAAGADPRGTGPDVFPSIHVWRAARGARAVQALVAAGPHGIEEHAQAIMEGFAAEEPQAPTVDIVTEVTQDLAVLEALMAAGAVPSPAALAVGEQCVPILRVAVERPRWTPELHSRLPPAFQAAAAALVCGIKRVSRGGRIPTAQPKFTITDDAIAEILTAAAYPLSDWADEEWLKAQRVKTAREVTRPGREDVPAVEGAQALPHLVDNIVELLQQGIMAHFGGGPGGGGPGGAPGGGGGGGPAGGGPGPFQALGPFPMPMPFPGIGPLGGLGAGGPAPAGPGGAGGPGGPGGLFGGLPAFPVPPGNDMPGGIAIPLAAIMQGGPAGPEIIPLGPAAAAGAGGVGGGAANPAHGPPPGFFQAMMEAMMEEMMGIGADNSDAEGEEEEEGQEGGGGGGAGDGMPGLMPMPFNLGGIGPGGPGGPGGGLMGAQIDIQIGLAGEEGEAAGEGGPQMPGDGFPLMMQFALPFPIPMPPGMGGMPGMGGPGPLGGGAGPAAAAPAAAPQPAAAAAEEEDEEAVDEDEEARPAKRRRVDRGGGGSGGDAAGGPRRSARNRRR